MKTLLILAALSTQLASRSAIHNSTSSQPPTSNTAIALTDSTLAGRPLKFYLEHPQIPQVCKDVFNKLRPPRDEVDVLSLMDSLLTLNKETRPFYFLTLTRTMPEADGAYAEPLGMMAKRFVETETMDFVKYFIEERILTNNDFEEWAMTVAGEIQISAAGQEQGEVDRLLLMMKSNCTACNESQSKFIEAFVKKVGEYCP